MLSGQNIICFPPNRWDGLWRNRQQIMSRLASQNKILYVHAPKDVRQLKPLLRRPHRLLTGPQITSPLPNLWVYEQPLYAPRSGRRPLREATFALRLNALKHTLRRLNMADDPILWLFSYEWAEFIGQLHEKFVIYHAVDEYSAYEIEYADQAGQGRRSLIQRLEAETIAQADLVFVTSDTLLESKRPLHPHVTLAPNGVAYDLFSDPAPGGFIPNDLADLDRPRIGFAGAINEKLDLQLLGDMARRRPHWQFLMVGPIALRYDLEQLAGIRTLPNLHFLGHKPVEQLPAYLHACDVCIMPYKRNEWTRNISPLKLYEYLATGLPIVSTDIPAARPFADTLHLADTADTFIAAIEAALAADTPARRAQQQALAQQHTWEQRLEVLSEAIEARLRVQRTQV